MSLADFQLLWALILVYLVTCMFFNLLALVTFIVVRTVRRVVWSRRTVAQEAEQILARHIHPSNHH